MILLRTKQPISYDSVHPDRTAIVYLRILTVTIDYRQRLNSFPNQYYIIEDGVAKLVRAFLTEVPADLYDQLVNATIPAENQSLLFDSFHGAIYAGSLAMIEQNGTLGTAAKDWETFVVNEGDPDFETHMTSTMENV